MPRIDRAPLADELSALETRGRWTLGSVDDLTPDGPGEGELAPEDFRSPVEAFLAGMDT